MVQLIDAFVAEFPKLQDAWMSALALVATALLAGWLFGRFMFRERIEGLKDELTRADRRIAEYKDNLNGATPAEVKARIDALEAQVARLKPAELSQSQVEAFRGAISRANPGTIMFARFIAGDTSRVPTQLRAVFSEHGWTVSDALIVGEADPAPSGIALHISAVPDHLPLSLVVKEALEAADISFALYKRDEQSADQNPKICFTQAT